jgi:hypothetical protein
MAAGSASAAAPGAITYVVVGHQDPNGKIPNFNVAQGAGTANISVPIPLREIVAGDTYSISIGSQNFAFAGGCTTAYELTAKKNGKVVVLGSGRTKPYACGKQTVWLYFFNTAPIPAEYGPATLLATQTYGKTVVKQTVSLIID